ncbi:hypothetical protein [Kitasatospora mediocidica]|uniref:hypothetical protein n=1 Tax=Kitasatospora mediocidica TaxID=58352 RepID=UPI0005669174|nr:hypothetical protein [Kitasatospora mediocidica]
MITHEDRRLRALAAQGSWAELLGIYRQTRAATAALSGERAAAREAAAFGHELAFAAPADVAAGLFDPSAGPGAVAGEYDGRVGPLWEVLATRHLWEVLDPLLPDEPIRTLVAHTRVLLGEDLTGTALVSPTPPPVLRSWELAGWEPGSRVTNYRRGGAAATALFSLPDSREGLGPIRLPAPGSALPGPDQPATAALRGLSSWLSTRCLRGSAPDAAALLAPSGSLATGGYIPFALAYPALVRAASGAGAYGEPGGAARGRIAVWEALGAMADPSASLRPGGTPTVPSCSADEVDALVARMRCFTWCDPADEIWHLHLALEDPATGLAWAVSGSDYD